MRKIFLDTETTGIEKDDRLIQLAYKCDETVVNELFTPPLPIKIGSMAVHHITEKKIAGKPSFIGSVVSENIQTLLNEDTVLIAHNAKFDVEMLRREGVVVGKFIDTLKVAKHLDPDSKIEIYALQYLRYLLGIDIEVDAHDALGDILVLEKVFERLAAKMNLEEMIEVSSKPSLIRKFTFGKHKGALLKDVDPSYLDWMLKEKLEEEEPDEDWLYTLRYYLSHE